MLRTCILTFLLILSLGLHARDHVIYSVYQEIPMGYDEEKAIKNYFVNIGENQGVKRGTILDVFRIISNVNPYDDRKRVNHKVKIGEIEVLHADSEASIAKMKNLFVDDDGLIFEVKGLIVGDHIEVKAN